ncbi:MAG: DmsE family decaheme c-type cytochrome [Burkholderiaceae bacterium]
MRIQVFMAAVCASLLAGWFATAASAQSAPAGAAQACVTCHEAYVASFMKGPHAAKGAKGSPAAKGEECVACHGDVSKHLQDPTKAKPAITFSKKEAASTKIEVCQKCHEGNRQLAFWAAGKHNQNEVACNSCHSVHGKTPDPRIGPFTTTQRTLEYQTCNTCHAQVRGQIQKTSHHPIIEGKVTCSDCHNPHGALSPVMLKSESVNDQCVSCHADKRGPYVFQHPAVAENCLSCHQPHGSTHNKLLNEKVPNLCQDCHDWSRHPGTMYSGKEGWPEVGKPVNTPSGFNTASTRFVARSCLNCHNAIHGSNAPANRGKFLTR